MGAPPKIRPRGGSINITNREFEQLLLRWGFELDRTGGKHHVYRHPDHAHKVTVGLSDGDAVPAYPAREAAHVLGVDILTFLNAPPRKHRPAHRKEEPMVTPPTPVPDEQTEQAEQARIDEHLPVIERILRFMQSRPDEPLTTGAISEALAIPLGPTSNALNRLVRKQASSGIVRLHSGKGRGDESVWGFDATLVTDGKPIQGRRSKFSRGWEPVPDAERVTPTDEQFEFVDAKSDDKEPAQPVFPDLAPSSTRLLMVEPVGTDHKGRRIVRMPDGTLVKLVPL